MGDTLEPNTLEPNTLEPDTLQSDRAESDRLAEARELFGPAAADAAAPRSMAAGFQLLWLLGAFAVVAVAATIVLYVVLRFLADHGERVYSAFWFLLNR